MADNKQSSSLPIAAFRKLCTQSLTYTPPTAADIAAAESVLGIRFPASYLEFLRLTADCTIQAWDFLRIYPGHKSPDDQNDIVDSNRWVHDEDAWAMPRTLVAFCGAGNGDYDCFDITAPTVGDELRIMCWQHDAEPGEPPFQSNDTFPQWLAEQIRDLSE